LFALIGPHTAQLPHQKPKNRTQRRSRAHQMRSPARAFRRIRSVMNRDGAKRTPNYESETAPLLYRIHLRKAAELDSPHLAFFGALAVKHSAPRDRRLAADFA
jgi:hypothetical protein